MTNKYVLDAHTVIWFLEGNPRLGVAATAILQEQSSQLYLPVIALAEMCHIVDRGRTGIPSVARMLAAIDADSRIIIVPLDRTIVDISLALPRVGEMHDRLIVATTLFLAGDGTPTVLLSRDQNITASGYVTIIW